MESFCSLCFLTLSAFIQHLSAIYCQNDCCEKALSIVMGSKRHFYDYACQDKDLTMNFKNLLQLCDKTVEAQIRHLFPRLFSAIVAVDTTRHLHIKTLLTL